MTQKNALRELAFTLLLILSFIIVGMLYLFLQADVARQKGLTDLAATFNTASIFFLIFTIISILVLILDKLRFLDSETDGLLAGDDSEDLGASLALGFIGMGIILFFGGLGTQSFSIIPLQSVFSQVGDALSSNFWKIFVVGLGAPLVEELGFAYAIPKIFFNIIAKGAKQFDLPIPLTINLLTVILITSFLFAFFHLGNAGLTLALFASIIFRTLILGIEYTDNFLDTIPLLKAGIGIGWGIHLVNNLAIITTPIAFVLTMLTGDGTPIGIFLGWLVLIFFVSNFALLGIKIKETVNGA